MIIREAIILAGGLGTRLRSVVPDLPKCMASINDQPFLTYVINYLQTQGITHFIFSLGYKSEHIIIFLKKNFPLLFYKICVEEQLLGTGGAVKKALLLAKDNCVLVANGDTLFKINTALLANTYLSSEASCVLSLKPMQNFDRYGVVEIDEWSIIKNFREKQFYESGLINGGVYAINKNKFLEESLPEKFSLEKDYIEKYYTSGRMYGVVQDKYFIDIGTSEDYERAQRELSNS